MHEALPDRYEVTRRGTQDPPASKYYVLDVVHDLDARVVLWMLVRKYRTYTGASVKADELEQLLRDTDKVVAERMRVRNEAAQTKTKRGPGRPKSARPKR